jgi:hypothetical protein
VSTARTNAAAGDTILFVDGTYTGGLDLNTNGTCTSPFDPDTTKIVWKAEHQHLAILTGTNAVIPSSNVFSDNDCNVIDGFTIKIPDQANTTEAVHASGSKNEIRNNLIYYDGTLVPTTGFAHADAINIHGLTWVHHNTILHATVGVGILGNGGASLPHASIVEYNTISLLDKGDPEDSDCFRGVQNSSVDGNYTGAEIRYNDCSGWYDDAVDLLDIDHVRVHHNNFHDATNSPLGLGHGVCLKLGYGSVGNIFFANQCINLATLAYGIDAQGAQSAQVYGNTVIGALYGVYLNPSTGPGTNNTFTNNTIIASQWGVFLAHNAVTGTVLRNNIINGMSGTDVFVTAGGTVTGNNNIMRHSKTSVGNGRFISTNDLVGDPLFVSASDYRLQSTSPARRAGAQVGLCIDVRGRVCNSPPDIGAYQESSIDPPKAPRALSIK